MGGMVSVTNKHKLATQPKMREIQIKQQVIGSILWTPGPHAGPPSVEVVVVVQHVLFEVDLCCIVWFEA